jgi:hypothetical protein
VRLWLTVVVIRAADSRSRRRCPQLPTVRM